MQVPGRCWPLNLIWKPPHGKGEVYVGGMQASTNRMLLQKVGITHVVNCMNRPSLNVQPGIEYFDFAIERYEAYRKDFPVVGDTSPDKVLAHHARTVQAFFEPAMAF